MLRYFVRWVYKKYSELIHGNGIKSILTNVFSATSHKIRYIPLYLAILVHDNNVNKTHVPNHVTLITLTIMVTFRSGLILTMCLETARALLQRPVIVVVGECACSLCHPTLATAAVWDCRDQRRDGRPTAFWPCYDHCLCMILGMHQGFVQCSVCLLLTMSIFNGQVIADDFERPLM